MDSVRPILPPFSSEDLLRQAVASLLTRMPDISGVQIRHGGQETGKDIVFHGPGPFGDIIPCACVVKNQRIVGEVGSSSGARTVLFQIQQSLDTPFTDGAGRDVRIQRVYLVCPLPISASALNSIAGALRERAGAMTVLGGHDLFRLFKLHWPGFLADEYSVFARYVEDARQQLLANRPLTNLTIQYGLGPPEQRFIYVSQSFNRRLRSYSCSRLEDLLPKWAVLAAPLTEIAVGGLLNDLRKLVSIVTHLSSWNIIPETASQWSVTLDSWGEILWEEWKHGSLVKSRSSQSPRRRLRDPKRLERLLQDIREEVSAVDSKLAKSLSRLNRFLRGPQHPVSIADAEFLHAVSLDECCASAPDGFFNAGIDIVLEWQSNLLDTKGGAFVCVGPPGSGKTSFCRWNALSDLERANVEAASTVPVYVSLRDASLDPGDTYSSSFLSFARASALAVDTSERGDKCFRFFLDGLDEVVDTVKQKRVAELAAQAVRDKHEVLITARDYINGPWLRSFPRLWLSGLNGSQVTELACGWLGREDAEVFSEQLSKVPPLHTLAAVPLLATLIILVFKQTRRIPESRVRLYTIFTDLLVGGWDIAKGVARPSRYGSEVKKAVLVRLAGRLQTIGRKEFDSGMFARAMTDTLGLSWKRDIANLEIEIQQDGLIHCSGAKMYFSHLSFQEYFAARDLTSDPASERFRRAVRALIGGEQGWREVIRFALGLYGDPRALVLWMVRAFGEQQDSTQFRWLLRVIREDFPSFAIDDIVDPGSL